MWLLALISLSLTFSAHASMNLKTQVHDIDFGNGKQEDFLLLSSGHVAWIKDSNLKAMNTFDKARLIGKWVNITINDEHELEYLQVITKPTDAKSLFSAEMAVEEEYTPTVIESVDVAKKYFQESRYVNKESQCYNRAHIWSYEWFVKHNVNSNKTWIFFTRKYIRKFKFDWWFHVSPSVPVREADGVIREKLMDVKYARGPINLKQWTDIFMRDDANCPMVKKYTDYANYPESGSCYTMRSSMFYYQPYEIESKETWGTSKNNWYDVEIKAAYLEAFNEEI